MVFEGSSLQCGSNDRVFRNGLTPLIFLFLTLDSSCHESPVSLASAYSRVITFAPLIPLQ